MSKDEKDLLLDDLDLYKSLDALADSEGGKVLINTHVKDVVARVDFLANGYASMDHMELVAGLADIKTKLDMLRTLTRAKANKEGVLKYIAELEEQAKL